MERDGTKTDVSNKKMGLEKVNFDETFATVLVHDILPTAAPEFKKQTEDGNSHQHQRTSATFGIEDDWHLWTNPMTEMFHFFT